MRFIILIICLAFTDVNNIRVKNDRFLPYEIYMESDRKKALLEKDKCMKGAYIGDENIYSDIKSFENYMGVNNDIYISRLKKGEDLPLNEIVDCYAKGKIPMIQLSSDYGSTYAMTAAKALGNINIPVFVEIQSSNASAYNCIAEIFRQYMPRSVLVYGISSDSNSYEFPDEELTDWVAVNAEEKMNNGFIMSEYENISKWCNYFKDKTIMLNISVPNFSTDRCNYAYSEAANEISNIYSLACDYANIGAINYISRIERNEGIVSCNYRITENPLLTSAYKNALASMDSNRYWSKTPYIAYVSGEKIIASNDVLMLCGIKGKYINSGYSEISAEGFNKSERKIFVKS